MKVLERAYTVKGGTPLSGTLKVNAAKNSVLVLMLAALLTREEVILRDIPRLSDILLMNNLLEHFGAEVRWQDRDLHIRADNIRNCSGPYHLVNKMRASFVALGALLGRCGEASMAMPGGCAFGPRPVDRHIKAFRSLGIEVTEDAGEFGVRRLETLQGHVHFEAPTVGGTQNIMLASALGQGEVIIENAAKEPEIVDLAIMLNRMGARIQGAGTSTIVIEAVKTLHGVNYHAIPDRIEAGTFMLAVAASRGKVSLQNLELGHLAAVIAKLTEAGVRFTKLDPNQVVVDATGELLPIRVVTAEYPGFPTDLQAPLGAFLATVSGSSEIEERVFPGHRFTHVNELRRMAADIQLSESQLLIQGQALKSAKVHSEDLRAGGALVVAALAAEGTSVITGVEYIERGYENLDARLRAVGADMHLEDIALTSTGTYGD